MRKKIMKIGETAAERKRRREWAKTIKVEHRKQPKKRINNLFKINPFR